MTGWLIIDEAFIDLTPELSFAGFSHLPSVIVLRSFGKFFGLAGLRVGFALAEQTMVATMAEHLGPWTVAGPSMYIAAQALAATTWQRQAKQQIQADGEWLLQLLTKHFASLAQRIVSGGLFVSVLGDAALMAAVYNSLAEQGVLVRLWQPPEDKERALLRFGLVAGADIKNRQRLGHALDRVTESCHF